MPILDAFLALLRRSCRSISTESGEVLAGILRKPRSPSPRDEIFPGLFVRELEPRRVLSASSIACAGGGPGADHQRRIAGRQQLARDIRSRTPGQYRRAVGKRFDPEPARRPSI